MKAARLLSVADGGQRCCTPCGWGLCPRNKWPTPGARLSWVGGAVLQCLGFCRPVTPTYDPHL